MNRPRELEEDRFLVAFTVDDQTEASSMDAIGIDVHKRESQICVLGSDGEVIEKRIATTRDRFRDFFGKLSKAKVLLESSTEAEWVARVLEELGHDVIVADPNFLPMYGSRSKRIKTDKRDARALADACRLGAYRPAHRRSEMQRERHHRLLVREKLVHMRVKSIQIVRSLLRQHGIGIPGGRPETFTARVSTVEIPTDVRELLAPILSALANIEKQIEGVEERINGIAKEDPATRRLMSVPGVGAITATSFVAMIDTVERFENPAQVGAFIGLVPGEHSSGDSKHRTRITKNGPRMLRSLLVQAALVLMRARATPAPTLKEWAERIKARRGGKVARVALARKLAGVMFAMMRDETNFVDQRQAA
jgi:transposase